MHVTFGSGNVLESGQLEDREGDGDNMKTDFREKIYEHGR
jgi:hypothetical protein